MLGHGRSGYVEEVESVSGFPANSSVEGQRFARKVIIVHTARFADDSRAIRREVNIILQLNHHHVIQIHATYELGRQFAIIMSPVADMNLAAYLIDHPRPDQDTPLRSWFGCLATGLGYIHSQRIKHRDIKPANILVRGRQVIYTDFGISRDVWDEVSTSTTGTVDARTPMYCAPEVAAEEPRGRAADIFSLGCVFLEMTTVLMWEQGCSLEKLHESKITPDGRRAYHATLDKTLQWILGLFAHGNSMGGAREEAKSTHLMLEWCLAMLQPQAGDRIMASQLERVIQAANSWMSLEQQKVSVAGGQPRTVATFWIGGCCKGTLGQPLRPVVTSVPNILQPWPDMSLDRIVDGAIDWNWEKVNKCLNYGE